MNTLVIASGKGTVSVCADRFHARPYQLVAALLSLILLTVPLSGFTAEPVSKAKRGDLAIGGHDTVAYHSLTRAPQQKAKKGKKTWVVEHLGAKWRFASEESARLFESNPDKYQPAYNGHCANALSLGKGLLKTNGKVWEIFGDQLYLFYAKKGRKRWLGVEDISDYKAAADKAWQAIVQQSK